MLSCVTGERCVDGRRREARARVNGASDPWRRCPGGTVANYEHTFGMGWLPQRPRPTPSLPSQAVLGYLKDPDPHRLGLWAPCPEPVNWMGRVRLPDGRLIRVYRFEAHAEELSCRAIPDSVQGSLEVL
jgi:hypothetical protein